MTKVGIRDKEYGATPVVAGDLVQLYIWTGGGDTINANFFGMCYDIQYLDNVRTITQPLV